MGEMLNDSPSLSSRDKQLNAAMFLKELSARTADIVIELSSLHKSFSESDNLSRDQKSMLKSLQQTIIPFMSASGPKLHQASKILSPISGLDYVHKREESKRKKDAQNEISTIKKTRKSSPLKRIELATHAAASNPVSIPITRQKTKKLTSVLPKTPPKPSSSSTTVITHTLSPPSNNLQYKPLEVIQLLSHPSGSKARHDMLKHLLKEQLVPIQKAGIYKLLQRHQKGEMIRNDWNYVGRKKLLSDDKVMEIKSDLHKHNGKTIAKEEIRKKIMETQ